MQNKIHPYPLLLILAFIINAILPFFAVYNLSADHTEARRLSSVFGEQIIICTGDGFKWVKLADLQSGKEKPTPHSDTKCPLCYAARHGLKDMALASAAIVPGYGLIPTPVYTAYDPILISYHRSSPLHVRAPPASFIG